ncbi:mitogen-activated protein kinase kinase kinase 17-like [Hibiscus syriacus]|uniref:mitogen-activated protein kinase kinase kinase 17-like n=1 Tax=Hibiscus syriacus TaxID=106335 RepID=UPI00192153C6|nr:mitogen-activated protein kinase kinase kinase 17-like [Hibiscus syriacus]
MDVKVVKIKVLGKGSYGVVHLVKTKTPLYNQCYGGFTSIERERGVVYNMFLEYASGGNLEDVINKYGGKIPEEISIVYTDDTWRAFEHSSKRFVHSDLKPANILVFPPQDGTGLPNLKIAEFGIAKEVTGAFGCMVSGMHRHSNDYRKQIAMGEL